MLACARQRWRSPGSSPWSCTGCWPTEPNSSPAGRPPKHRPGGNHEFGRTDTKRPEQVPSPGRWIRSGRSAASGSRRDCAFLDWPADPHQTPSGGSSALTPDRSKTPATGSRSKGIDTRWPVTEAALLQAPFRSKARSRRQGGSRRVDTLSPEYGPTKRARLIGRSRSLVHASRSSFTPQGRALKSNVLVKEAQSRHARLTRSEATHACDLALHNRSNHLIHRNRLAGVATCHACSVAPMKKPAPKGRRVWPDITVQRRGSVALCNLSLRIAQRQITFALPVEPTSGKERARPVAPRRAQRLGGVLSAAHPLTLLCEQGLTKDRNLAVLQA